MKLTIALYLVIGYYFAVLYNHDFGRGISARAAVWRFVRLFSAWPYYAVKGLKNLKEEGR